jgi:hypothetical protein
MKACTICGSSFTPRSRTSKTCTLECQVKHRRKLARERIARTYKPRPLRPDTECESCQGRVPAPRTGPMPRWCSECRANRSDARARKRVAVRRCYKCETPLPAAARKPGKAVCEDCRVDKRQRGRDYEQRRRFRKYGITQDDYERMISDQDGRCLGCGTTDPGPKGWHIDHCHTSGSVRALLCYRCNTILGFAKDDPGLLRDLAELAERFKGE